MPEIPRIDPQATRTRVVAGQALLVCAYSDPEKFAAFHLDGALSWDEYRALRPTLPKDREVIFYCA